METKKTKSGRNQVNAILEQNELDMLEEIVARDKSNRSAVVRKAIAVLHAVCIDKPDLYQKIFANNI